MSKSDNYEIENIYASCIKYFIVASILLFSLFYKNISYALGFVLGGIACLINFNLMVKSLEGMIEKTTNSKAFFSGLFLARMLVIVAVLWSGIKLESVNLFTAILGI
ncbi:MAG TPA: ATP synthase subunit I, partial [Candidatus Nitrosocosmicus sp.]|nr:ATP synthase subunit I [Candidatus Nitrosocosmicus sp.]